jgi:alkylhydroperoxidase family enzyme
MTDARIPLLSADEAKAAASDAGVSEYMAEFNIFHVLLHHPRLARAIDDLLTTMLRQNVLDARSRQLAIMRIAWLTATDYEWSVHWRVSQRFGVPVADLLAVCNWTDHRRFGPKDRAVLAAADDVVREGAISSATWAICERELGPDPAVLIEMVTAIGTWRMIATILQSLQVPLEPGADSWPLDGPPPQTLINPTKG